MDRTEKVFINGKRRLMNYGIGVLWDVEEKYKTVADAMKETVKPGKEGFEAVRWLAVELANNGEMLRRQMGFEKEEFLTEGDIQPTMAPAEYIPMRNAVMSVLQKGYQQENDNPDREYDLGLAELNEKKQGPVV